MNHRQQGGNKQQTGKSLHTILHNNRSRVDVIVPSVPMAPGINGSILHQVSPFAFLRFQVVCELLPFIPIVSLVVGEEKFTEALLRRGKKTSKSHNQCETTRILTV